MSKKDELKNSLKGSLSTPLSADDKEKELELLMSGKGSSKAPTTAEDDEPTGGKEKTRVTLDLSKPLARKVKAEAANRDQTMKGFIVELLNRYFDEKSSK